jgi:hypothetical protein
MSHKVRFAVGAVLAAAIAVLGGATYATATAPYFASVARLIAHGHPWQIQSVEVSPPSARPGRELRLTAQVYKYQGKPDPDATVVRRVQVGEVIEAFAVFWPMLLLWPVASNRQRLIACLMGVPIFLLLDAATTGIQLVAPLAQASAMLAGNSNPLTAWERYCRFMEAGGRFVLETCAVLITLAIARTLTRPRVDRESHALKRAHEPS